MQLGALTHACFAMLKPEKLTASFENRSLILLSLQLPSLQRGDGDNTYHPADGKNAAGDFSAFLTPLWVAEQSQLFQGNACARNPVPSQGGEGHGQWAQQ